MAKIKLYIGIAIAAVIGVLSALFKIEKAERKIAEQKADIYKDQLTENAKVVESHKYAQKAKKEVMQKDEEELRKPDPYSRT